MSGIVSSESLSTMLKQVCDLAIDAGRAIMKEYSESDFGVTHKDDRSPLTQADLESHRIIKLGLEQLSQEWPVLSEESEGVPYERRREWSQFWLVDPLDGTKEFLKRNGEFTVNIALIRNRTPILGVVYAPAIEKMYFAARGFGAFKCENGISRPIRVNRSTSDVTRVVVSRSHEDDLDQFVRRFGKCEFSPMGSSLKFCLVAEGAADVYPRSGPTMEWDTAAAQCVVEQAGGRVMALDGSPLEYNKPVMLNSGFVACGII